MLALASRFEVAVVLTIRIPSTKTYAKHLAERD